MATVSFEVLGDRKSSFNNMGDVSSAVRFAGALHDCQGPTKSVVKGAGTSLKHEGTNH
jgi:hypothetical protein